MLRLFKIFSALCRKASQDCFIELLKILLFCNILKLSKITLKKYVSRLRTNSFHKVLKPEIKALFICPSKT